MTGSASPSMTGQHGPRRRAVIVSTVGTTIEWYDFFLYKETRAKCGRGVTWSPRRLCQLWALTSESWECAKEPVFDLVGNRSFPGCQSPSSCARIDSDDQGIRG